MNKFDPLFKLHFYKLSTAVLLIGLGGGISSYLFHEIIHWATVRLHTFETFTFTTYAYALALAFLSYFLTQKYFNGTNGSGIPQVKLAIVTKKGSMLKRMTLGKFITSALSLCSGLSFGKEGPLVAISAAWGHLISHMFKLNPKITKILVSSGATAGLAAAFNAPIAAVVFTIEEILGELNTKYLGPIIVTSVLASFTSYTLMGGKSTFISSSHEFHIEWHLILYLVLGLLMSLVGFLFTKLILSLKEIRKRYFKKLDYLYIGIVVTLVAIASNFSKEVLGDGISTINQILSGAEINSFTFLLVLFVLKLCLTSASYSTGLSGGLFMPVIFLGAIGGSAYAGFLTEIGIAQIEVDAFALIGMTSLLVAVIRTPFTAFLMLFEMTRDYELILPLMFSSITAYLVSNMINPSSVYESVAEYEDVHLPIQSDNECLHEVSVDECMIKDVVTLSLQDSSDKIKDLTKESDYRWFPVLNFNKLLGVVSKYDLDKALGSEEEWDLRGLVKNQMISIHSDQNLIIALDRMKKFDINLIPVVSRYNSKQLLGIISMSDIFEYFRLNKNI